MQYNEINNLFVSKENLNNPYRENTIMLTKHEAC